MDIPDNIDYSVVTSIDINSPFGKLMSRFGSTITTDEGIALLHFWCSHVNAEHHVYLELVAHSPPTEPGLRIRIPHHMVLLISDPQMAEKKLGFLS